MEVFDKLTWERKWKTVSSNGEKTILSSFMLSNNHLGSLGSFSVPTKFHKEIGHNLNSAIFIRCQKCVWQAKYNADSMEISGLPNFMIFYEVELFNLLQFEYYGNDIFNVTIFKESGIECNYPIIHPVKYLQSEEAKKWRKGQLKPEVSSMEYEKNAALFCFNALKNVSNYYEIDIISNSFDDDCSHKVIMNKDLWKLYENWETGSKVILTLCKKSWEIEIAWLGGKCAFGKGWTDFFNATELEVGDKLVLYESADTNNRILNVCIFKGHDYIEGEVLNASKRSFFKIVTTEVLEGGMMLVPKIVKDKYSEELKSLEKLEVAGERCFISYDSNDGQMTNIREMMDFFKMKENDIIIFKFCGRNMISAKLYEHDGMEFDYYNRTLRFPKNPSTQCFWNLENYLESDQQLGNKGENGKEEDMVVDNSSYLRFIIVLTTEQCSNDVLILPTKFVSELVEEIPLQVRLQLPSGRRISVQYRKDIQALANFADLINECKRGPGSILVFSYQGAGMFLVYILDEFGSEIEYMLPNNYDSDTFCHQDTINGIGWKFITIADECTVLDGEVDIPDPFFKRFGKVIPPAILCALPYGKLFECRYSQSSSLLYGLTDMVRYTKLDIDDVLMCTYWGSGQFDIVLFDKSGVEMSIQQLGENAEANNEDIDETEANNANADNEVEEPEQNIDFVPQEFTAVMNKSNVNSTSHGVYIPKTITPHDRQWIGNEQVMLITEIGEWAVGLVLSKGLPRISAGWNKFAKDNKLKRNQVLTFNLLEDEHDGAVFLVDLH